jgi:hypothetical protein
LDDYWNEVFLQDFHSSGMFPGVGWQLVTDVAGHPIVPLSRFDRWAVPKRQ